MRAKAVAAAATVCRKPKAETQTAGVPHRLLHAVRDVGTCAVRPRSVRVHFVHLLLQ